MEQGPTWFAERKEALEYWFLDLLVFRGMVVSSLLRRKLTTTKVQRRKSLRNKGFGRKRERIGLGEDEEWKSGKEGKFSPFISPRIIKSKSLDRIQWKSMAGGLEERSMVKLKDLFKNLNQWLRFGRDEMPRTLMMRGRAAQALKAPCSNQRATSRGTTCLQEMKRQLLKKLTQETRYHVLWSDTLSAIPATIQPIPDMDLRLKITTLNWSSKTIMLGPYKLIATSNWPSKMAMHGLRWRGYRLELTFNDCHAWPPQSHHNLELAAKGGHAWS